jgi:hypothetical protein
MKRIGYHGTDQVNAERILREGFKESDKPNLYLGKGVYFFEATGLTRGIPEASEFAHERRHTNQALVICASIECEDQDVLDLVSDSQARSLFQECRRKALELHVRAGRPELSFRDQLIFAIIDRTCKYAVVRCLVEGHREHTYHSYVVRHPQMILCTKAGGCIKHMMIVTDGGGIWKSTN